MLPTKGDTQVCAWTNGRKADAYLMRQPDGTEYVTKRYRSGQALIMLREALTLGYLSRRIAQVPKLLGVQFSRQTLFMSYVAGDRVLEWVLARYSLETVDLDAFRSFHGLNTNETVQAAFRRLREDDSSQSRAFRAAIHGAYDALHALRWIHGSADPRNVIYDGSKAFIIDFDHARPCWSARQKEAATLDRWFGVPSGR